MFYVELLIQRSFLPFQPFEALLKETQRLYLEFPPSTLEKDVKERYRRYREQMKPPSKPRPPKKVRDASVKVAQLELPFVLQGSFFQRDWHRGHSARRGGSGRRHRRVPLAERELYAGGSSNGVSPKLHFSAVPTLRLNFQHTTWIFCDFVCKLLKSPILLPSWTLSPVSGLPGSRGSGSGYAEVRQ